MKNALEGIYNHHHTHTRGRNFMVLGKVRGAFLRKHVGNHKKVLDIGCRDGELTREYAQDNEILGLDIDGDALEIAEKKIPGMRTKHIDLNGEWSVGGEYDVVVACEVLEHIYYPSRVLGKIHETLKGGGILVGSIPHAFSLQTRIKFLFGIKTSTPLCDPTHINHFSQKEFKELLSEKFDNVHIEGITTPRYKWLRKLFPFLFAHTLLFYGKKI